MSEVTVRRYRETDLDAVLEVLRASLGETPLLERTPELFRWKHFANPFGESIILVAEVGGQIAGVRAFMRWDLVDPAGHLVRCVRAVDTATHPGFLRRGIFKTLTMAAIDEAEADGVDLIFNTPNDKSGAGYIKMGWQDVGTVGVMVRPSWRMMRKRADEASLPDPEQFLEAPTSVGSMFVPDRAPTGLRTRRSAAYWSWRYNDHPTARYFVVGGPAGAALVRPNHRNGRRELVVSELAGDRHRAALAALSRASKADYMAAWFSPGPERAAATRALLVPVPKLSALRLVARPLSDLAVDPLQFSAWDLALSDLELL